ncbi:MAG: hypothetical protein ACE5DX_04540 [Candidatus Dojkabacteria bacterium]
MNVVTIVVLVIVVALSIVFFLRSKVKEVLAVSLKFIFPLLALLVLSALFVPQGYEAVARFSLEQTGTLETIRGFDEQLDPILSLPVNLLQGFSDIFSPSEDSDTSEVPEAGFVESKVFPLLVSSSTLILRASAIVLGVLGMAAVIYMSYGFQDVSENMKLKGKIKELEERLRRLELNRSPDLG